MGNTSKNYLVINERATDEFIVHTYDSVNAVLRAAAEFYAYSDCDCDEAFSMVDIVADGQTLFYSGWQPDMQFDFCDCLSGEVVYTRWFPQFDH